MDKIPFDPYDFFGYLASGLLLLVAAQQLLGFPRVVGSGLGFLDSALLLLMVYVAGQIVATPAKAILEDLVVDKILAPPSVVLLADRKPPIKAFLFPGYYKSLPEATRRKVLEKAANAGVSLRGEELFSQVRYGRDVVNNAYLASRGPEHIPEQIWLLAERCLHQYHCRPGVPGQGVARGGLQPFEVRRGRHHRWRLPFLSIPEVHSTILV